jgi:two-component system nitrogen regulation response regulator GlnG
MNTVWIVDDDASIRFVLERALERSGFIVKSYERGDAVLEALGRRTPDVLVTDIRMPGMSGLDLLGEVRERAPRLPVIVMTAHTDLDAAVASYQGGAFEYLPKPFDVDEAVRLVARAAEQHSQDSAAAEPGAARLPDILGEAPAMQEVFRAIGRLAHSNVNVLITGESGTGKELVARALHRHGPRAARPFIAINTPAIPSELLESELFGHEKGAFTGAHERRVGRFEQADGGTLFLDEIGDMPAELQTRLLRVLADGRFFRVGGREEVRADVRVITATNQDLEARVRDGRFREDLYHRLHVIRIALPPLRERRSDNPLLARHFLEQSAHEMRVEPKRLSAEALQALQNHQWPGNVRQLENLCRRLTVMAPGQVVTPADLPPEWTSPSASEPATDWELLLRRQVERRLNQGESGLMDTLGARFERILLEAALAHTGGHRQEAAKRLGWGRNTLTRKAKDLDVS